MQGEWRERRGTMGNDGERCGLDLIQFWVGKHGGERHGGETTLGNDRAACLDVPYLVKVWFSLFSSDFCLKTDILIFCCENDVVSCPICPRILTFSLFLVKFNPGNSGESTGFWLENDKKSRFPAKMSIISLLSHRNASLRRFHVLLRCDARERRRSPCCSHGETTTLFPNRSNLTPKSCDHPVLTNQSASFIQISNK